MRPGPTARPQGRAARPRRMRLRTPASLGRRGPRRGLDSTSPGARGRQPGAAGIPADSRAAVRRGDHRVGAWTSTTAPTRMRTAGCGGAGELVAVEPDFGRAQRTSLRTRPRAGSGRSVVPVSSDSRASALTRGASPAKLVERAGVEHDRPLPGWSGQRRRDQPAELGPGHRRLSPRRDRTWRRSSASSASNSRVFARGRPSRR